MADITFDSSDFDAKILQFGISAKQKNNKALEDVATEVLHLSSFEVPHDTGNLQNSGQVEDGQDENEKLVGYNTKYAAYQHEGVRADGTHVVTHWQSGRKKKYLEDPIRNNLDRFKAYWNGVFE